jgi:hypothetical protein
MAPRGASGCEGCVLQTRGVCAQPIALAVLSPVHDPGGKHMGSENPLTGTQDSCCARAAEAAAAGVLGSFRPEGDTPGAKIAGRADRQYPLAKFL